MIVRSALIYCNADLESGMGHLARSLCIAEEAQSRGWKVTVAGRFGGRAIEHAAALAPGQELMPLSPENPQGGLSELLTTCEPGVLHLDTYDIGFDSFNAGNVFVSNMQDGEHGRRAADLHIDANLDAELRYRPIAVSESAILGTSGMQIRGAFRSMGHEPRADLVAPFRVLVMIGGTDPFNLTPRLIRELAAYAELQLTVICRPETHLELAESLGARASEVRLLAFTGDLPALAGSMDLVITAAGTSVWDFAAAGIPMGLVAVADNQLPGYRSCAAHGLGFLLGEPPHDDLGERVGVLVTMLRDRERMQRNSNLGARLVDGLGAWRVVSAWEELSRARLGPAPSAAPRAQAELAARVATEEDARRLFDWRNDADTRAASRAQGQIVWEDHTAWFERALKDQDRKLLIIEDGAEAVATVRWDRRGGRAWEVSITLAPEHRGRGRAASVLAAAESVFSEGKPTQLFAGIHLTNTASRHLFAGAGYLPHLPADAAGFEMRAKWVLPD